MDASRPKPDAPPSSASLCPGCGKAIDPLRAGHVAILEGGFRYFCGAECKATYVDVASKRLSLEALTAEPPAVTVARSGPRVKEPEPEPTPEPEAEPGANAEAEAEAEAEERSQSPASARSADAPLAEGDGRGGGSRAERVRGAVGPHEEDEPPHTLRSPDVREAPAVDAAPAAAPASRAPRGPRANADAEGAIARIIASSPAVGVALGVLATVVSLGGETAAALRLPLALVAAAILVAYGILRPREPSVPSSWLLVASIVLGAGGAVLAVSLRDPHAESHAAYVGLAAATALLVELLTTRARRDVVDARARVSRALDLKVRVVRGDETADVDSAHVKPGEQVVVEAGETVGVDGVVAAGDAEVAPWLDSPVVLAKREGDAVVAGAVVVSGRLRVTATFAGAERAWLRLGCSPGARVDVAAPLVLGARRVVERGAPAAALVAAAATYANNGAWSDVVVAASAGAYVVAAASAVAAAALAHARGHVAAQRRGIVYKDADAFDAAARADVAVVCSRGTILLGEPEIVAVEPVGTKAREAGDGARVLSLAAGAEMASSDAFAAAILRAARARGVRAETVRSALVHSGLGVTALAPSGDKVVVGSRAFLLQEKVSVAIADARVSELEAEGRSVLLVALGGRLVGLLALQDGLRPGARAAVQRMHDARIEPVFLSGEARETCETIARALDIEHVRPEILPAERGAEVRALADGGRVVAAIGHPSSDDGALGAADVSVAMTAAGSAPGEWGVTLASDDVRDAALALTVPRACRERAKTALVVGAAGQGLSLIAIAFGAAPPLLVPVVGALAAIFALSAVREPTNLPSR